MNFKQYQENKPNIVELKRKLNMKFETWDAISFFRHWSSDQYVFDIIKYVPKNGVACEYEVNSEGLGNKYLMLTADMKGMRQDELVLGDPIHIILMNYIPGREQGFVMKKCPEGIEMAAKILERAENAIKLFKTFIEGNTANRV